MKGLFLIVCAVVVGLFAPAAQALTLSGDYVPTPPPKKSFHLENGDLRRKWLAFPNGREVNLGGLGRVNQLAHKEVRFEITDPTSNFVSLRVVPQSIWAQVLGSPNYSVTISVNNSIFRVDAGSSSSAIFDFNDFGGPAKSFSLALDGIFTSRPSINGFQIAHNKTLYAYVEFDAPTANFAIETTNWVSAIPEPSSVLLFLGLSTLFLRRKVSIGS